MPLTPGLAGVVWGNFSHRGSRASTFANVSERVSPGKATPPLRASNKTQPNAQMSVLLSTTFPRACSGLM